MSSSIARRVAAAGLCALALTLAACRRGSPPAAPGQGQATPAPEASGAGQQPPAPASSSPTPPAFEVQAVSTQEGEATWYDVPARSLPERRAWHEEFTAAHDRLPVGTYARVTNRRNGKDVIVRITDHGIHQKGTILDLSRPAAEALGIVDAGRVPVRLEALKLSAVVESPAPVRHENRELTAKPVEPKDDNGKLEPGDGKLPARAAPPATKADEKAAAQAKPDNDQTPPLKSP